MEIYITEYGSWPRISGDNEMAINGDDVVDVKAGMTFTLSSNNKIDLTLTFNIHEDGGGTTAFGGTKKLTYQYTGTGAIIGISGKTQYTLFDQAQRYNADGSDGRYGSFPDEQCDIVTACVNPFFTESAEIKWIADGTGDDDGRVGIRGCLLLNVIVIKE